MASKTEEKSDGARSAMNSVLGIPELFEMILLRLDMNTLLISAPRVCKHWQTTISQSRPLQRHLFFLPDEDRPPADKIQNPLLVHRFSPLFADNSDLNYTLRGRKQLILPREPENASWKRMLVAQPAVRRLGYFKTFDEKVQGTLILDETDGLHMPRFCELLEQLRRGHIVQEAVAPAKPPRWADYLEAVPEEDGDYRHWAWWYMDRLPDVSRQPDYVAKKLDEWVGEVDMVIGDIWEEADYGCTLGFPLMD